MTTTDGDRDRGLGEDDMITIFRDVTGMPGAGIALHVTRGMSQLHGGSIDTESRVGRGPGFVVRLPDTLPRDDSDGAAAA